MVKNVITYPSIFLKFLCMHILVSTQQFGIGSSDFNIVKLFIMKLQQLVPKASYQYCSTQVDPKLVMVGDLVIHPCAHICGCSFTNMPKADCLVSDSLL